MTACRLAPLYTAQFLHLRIVLATVSLGLPTLINAIMAIPHAHKPTWSRQPFIRLSSSVIPDWGFKVTIKTTHHKRWADLMHFVSDVEDLAQRWVATFPGFRSWTVWKKVNSLLWYSTSEETSNKAPGPTDHMPELSKLWFCKSGHPGTR